MQKRYTVKKYNSEGKLSNEIKEQLKSILHLSPSSINSQPWKFTFVEDSKAKSEFAEVSYFNKEKINDSQLLVVFQVLKNAEDFEKQIEGNLPEGSIEYYNKMIKPHGEDYTKSWMSHQVYLALGVLLSACAQMEIDSTPMEGIEIAKYDAILNNEKYTTLFAVAIGVRDENDFNQPKLKAKSRLNFEEILDVI
ncbi:nitroreductase family protein [Epilithonimonas sp.]|uniref:nitroreductase family protein n=1 Tax=Epilithonimonas sp. TaxID=2894511 RepID=UPI0028A75B9F|nr:nitroreductase family protein [Epilithonimonas sp.]